MKKKDYNGTFLFNLGYSWQYLTILCDTWWYLAIPDNTFTILTNTKQYLPILNNTYQFQTILTNTKQYQTISDKPCISWYRLVLTKYQVLLPYDSSTIKVLSWYSSDVFCLSGIIMVLILAIFAKPSMLKADTHESSSILIYTH